MGQHEFHAIYDYISTLPVFSDHDHHQTDEFFAEGVTLDKLLSNSYVAWTGYTCDGSDEARAKLLENVRYNSYFTWFQRGLQKVHGIDHELTAENWQEVSDKVAARYAADADFHWRALLANGYKRLILDTYWNPGSDNGHPEAFVPTFRIDKFMYGHHAEAIAPDEFPVWQRYGFEGGSLAEFVEMLRATIKGRYEQGKIAALKCAEAYHRDINFLPDDKAAAEKAFGKHPKEIGDGELRAFSSYIFNRACELAEELDVPFQVHTGLGELAGSQPMKFEPMLIKYPKVRFVLFHSGYPWTDEAAGLTHNHANALPSLTWTATICTSAAIRALGDFIDVAASCNSITWGSDCWVAEESIGAMLAWRFVVAKVLAERLADGRLTASRAEALARKLMYENGRSVYAVAPA